MHYLLLVDDGNRPLGWVGRGRRPDRGHPDRGDGQPGLAPVNKRTTLKDALSMMLDADVQTGIVVDRTGAVQGLLTIAVIAEKMREGEHVAAYDAAVAGEPDEPGPGEEDGTERRRAGRGGARSGRAAAMIEGKPLIDFDWIAGHLDERRPADRPAPPADDPAADHPGLLISLVLSVWAVRQPRTYGPVTAITGLLYTIPSLAAFAFLRPIFGLSLLTALIPLTTYTLLILLRNFTAGFTRRAGRRSSRRPRGWATRAASASSGSSCPLPCR